MKRTTFINKYADSGNVAQSTHEERRLINERNREHRKPQRSKKKSQKKQQHDTGSMEPCSGHAQVITAVNTLITASPSDDVPTVLAKDKVSVFDKEAPPHSPRSQSVMLQVFRSPGNSIDPFNASTISPNDTTIQLLRYYKQVYYTVLWDRVRHAFNGDIASYGIIRCPPEEIVLECMQNRARIYTLLANLACQIKYTNKDTCCLDTDDLIQKAMQAFLEEFRTKVRIDGDMICNALHLYLAVSAIDQTEAANAHLRGLLAIIQRIIDQGDRIIKPQAALVAIVDLNLSKRLLLDPTQVCEREAKLLGAIDIQYLKSEGKSVHNGMEPVV